MKRNNHYLLACLCLFVCSCSHSNRQCTAVPVSEAEKGEVVYTYGSDNMIMGLYLSDNDQIVALTLQEPFFSVIDVKTNSVMMMTSDSSYWYQRVFGSRAEEKKSLTDSELRGLVTQVQDTMQEYNGKLFTVDDLKSVEPELQGFVIAARKIYFRTNSGLFVANIDGSFTEPIWSGQILTECADAVNNRLYWAVKDSVMYMPLIGSENNKFTTTPTMLNETKNVVKLLIDKDKR